MHECMHTVQRDAWAHARGVRVQTFDSTRGDRVCWRREREGRAGDLKTAYAHKSQKAS